MFVRRGTQAVPINPYWRRTSMDPLSKPVILPGISQHELEWLHKRLINIRDSAIDTSDAQERQRAEYWLAAVDQVLESLRLEPFS